MIQPPKLNPDAFERLLDMAFLASPGQLHQLWALLNHVDNDDEANEQPAAPAVSDDDIDAVLAKAGWERIAA